MDASTLRWILIIVGLFILGLILVFGNPGKKKKPRASRKESGRAARAGGKAERVRREPTMGPVSEHDESGADDDLEPGDQGELDIESAQTPARPATPSGPPPPADRAMDHEQRLRKVEKCQRDTASSLSHIEANLDKSAKNLRWFVGLAVTVFALAALGAIFKAGALQERLDNTAAQVRDVAVGQRQQTDTLNEVRDNVTEAVSDGRNQRRSNQLAIDRIEKALREHAARRRH